MTSFVDCYAETQMIGPGKFRGGNDCFDVGKGERMLLAPRLCGKLMGISTLFETGWPPQYDLESGLKHAYAWSMDHVEKGEARLKIP